MDLRSITGGQPLFEGVLVLKDEEISLLRWEELGVVNNNHEDGLGWTTTLTSTTTTTAKNGD